MGYKIYKERASEDDNDDCAEADGDIENLYSPYNGSNIKLKKDLT